MSDIINMKKSGSVNPVKIVGFSALGLVILLIIFNTFVSIKAGHTGVVTTFGKVNDTVLTEGLHLKIPFVQNVVLVDNRVLKTEVSCMSASKDLQNVSSGIALNYRVANAKSADLYKNVGIDYQNTIVIPTIQDGIKAVTARFTAEELITNRQSVGEQMSELVSSKLNSYGIFVENLNIINFEFSDEFNAAIEAKQTAEQNALKAEQDLARIKVEAQQKIEQARAEAEAYRLKSESITNEMILMEYLSKWDGKLPTVVSDGTTMIDISKMLEQTTPKTTTPTPAK